MKIIIETSTKENLYQNITDGLILSLQDFAVQSEVYYSLEEIKNIVEANPHLEIFVNINKNIFNSEIEKLKNILFELEEIKITGIIFYDLALIKLKQELNLKKDLVWSQTHMVNNYKTCNYYHSKGVKYAYLGKEITLEEIKEIIAKSTITSMVEIIGYPTVGFSRRHLLTNYYKDINKEPKLKLDIKEKITSDTYEVTEDDNGTNFILKKLTNGTPIIKELYKSNLKYIIMKEYGISQDIFKELLIDTKKYIEGNCLDENYIDKYKKLGDNTNFFFKKTIYQVKKNG